MKHPEISIVIPFYNVEKYIGECLGSVAAQTFDNVEIILVNDGSSDRSADIAREYMARDPRMKIIDQPNSGISVARNTGMAAATAPLLMFVDSDDTVEPDYCRKLREALTDEVDTVVCGVRFAYENNVEPNPGLEALFELPLDQTQEYPPTLWNKIYRLDPIREHGIEFPVGLKNEDEFFWNAYLPWSRGIACVPEKLYNYRRRPGSIMSDMLVDRGQLRADVLQIAAELGRYYDRHGLMNNDLWAEHFWRVFDRLSGDAQMYRPWRFKERAWRKQKCWRRFLKPFAKPSKPHTS
ncbi:MAG: glycosyltransferase [Alistipes sp.]|jgi:glycosyltransferase EpsH|nr:glycosyltransferase [Alistipes sp.]